MNYATIFKVRLSDGAVVWHAKKPRFPRAWLESTAVLYDPGEDWIADAGIRISVDANTISTWASRTDLGSSFDALVSSSMPSVTIPKTADYYHWCLSKDGEGNSRVWGIPSDVSTKPAWTGGPVPPTPPEDNSYIIGYSPDDGESEITIIVNGGTQSTSGGIGYTNLGYMADKRNPSRKNLAPNGSGGVIVGWWRSDFIPDRDAHIDGSGLFSLNRTGTAIGSATVYDFAMLSYGIPLVRHGDSHIAYKSVLGSGTSMRFTGIALAHVDSLGSGSFIQLNNTNITYNNRTTHGADAIDSNGTNIALRIPGQRTLYLVDSDLNVIFSYADPTVTNWIAISQSICAGADSIYNSSLTNDGVFVRKYNGSGVVWSKNIGSIPETIATDYEASYYRVIFDSREREGVVYCSGLCVIDDKLCHVWAIDADTGDIIWSRQLLDDSVVNAHGADFEFSDDGEHMYVACSGKVKIA
ncbi:MAG TPA: hypothetical protein VNQ76_14130 [Planctomicrobium sp.]|nr:hypothetical protein [Planctomicrobium sp.]